MDAHPERLEQLLGGRGIQSPRQVPEEPVAPSLVQAIEGGGIAAHIRVHQRLVGRRFVQVGPRRVLDCCEARMEAPLAPALSEPSVSLIAIPAGVPLTVSPSALETGAIGGAPLLFALAAGPPLFLKVRALLI